MGIFMHDWHALTRRLRPGRRWFMVPALAAGLALASAAAVYAQGAVKSVHKDWQIRCDTPPGAKNEQCALIQSVTA